MLGLVVTVPASEIELAADALWALGVTGIEERGEPSDGFVELWTSLGDDPEVVAHAATGFPARWRWHLVELDPSVTETWRAHAVPTWVDHDLVVVPAWVRFEARPGTIAVRIEPGATFGLGDHPTTMLTLRELRRVLTPGARVLDVGCGSGVLAVTAAVLGAGAAVAVDLSPAAPAVAVANAEANQVADLVTASTTALVDVDGAFDVVLANILAPALVDLGPDLVRVLAPGGSLIISGVLAGRYDHVVAALSPLQVVDEATKDGWAAVVLRH